MFNFYLKKKFVERTEMPGK